MTTVTVFSIEKCKGILRIMTSAVHTVRYAQWQE